MSDAQDVEAEGKGLQTGFISHLVELRDRLIKAAAAVVAIFVVLFMYPSWSRSK